MAGRGVLTHSTRPYQIARGDSDMSNARLIPIDYLHKVLICDPDAGKLYWRERTEETHSNARGRAIFNGLHAGKEAITCLETHGYMTGRIDRVFFKAHRLIWAMTYGEWPDGEIDHINGNRADNRISNLRVVSRSGNMRNTAARSDNTSGEPAIVWHKGGKKWMVRVGDKYVGLFSSMDDAIVARNRTWAKMGYHPNHGRSA
jgi:hypothetical protein